MNTNRYDSMIYNKSGKSGLKLPAVSLGLWHNFGTEAAMDTMQEMLLTAFNHGITHFDLANNYGPEPGSAEVNFGKILKQSFQGYRDELVISTKAGFPMWSGPYGDWGSRKYLLSSLDQSLNRMQLDYVDIFYHHRMDPDTPLEETMGALASAVQSGKALYAGISNYDRKTTEKAIAIMKGLRCPLIINQVRYSIYDRHIELDGLKPYCEENGLGLIIFSPLAQGLLSTRYLQGIPQDSRINKDHRFLKEDALTEERLNSIQKLNELAGKRNQTLAQMALSWVLKDDAITSVLIGASRASQILENIEAIHHTDFTQEELDDIDRYSF